MESLCAWCRTPLSSDLEASGQQATSHGICGACSWRLQQEIPVNLTGYLQQVDIPLVVVRQDITATYVNPVASRLLGTPSQEAGPVGAILFCRNAQSPEGCGRTQHCSGCTLRRCLTVTHGTGAPFVDVPLRLQRSGPTGVTDLDLRFSTLLVGDLLLLRLDEGKPAEAPQPS